MTHTPTRRWAAAVAAAVSLCAAARGQTTYGWNHTGTAWNDAASWGVSSGYPGTAADDVAAFTPQVGGFSPKTPLLAGSYAFQQLLVANTPALGNTTFGGSGTFTLSAAAALGGVTVRGVGTTAFAGPSVAGASAANLAVLSVGHAAGLTFTGSSVANANVGPALVQGGTLTVDNASTNTPNRLALGATTLTLQDGGAFDYRANAAGGTATISTGTTGLTFTSGNATVRVTLAAVPTGPTVLQFGGYTRGLQAGATVNFVVDAPAGVTLGGGGTNPRVTFTDPSNANLTDGQLLQANSSSNTAGGNARALAFVNGLHFAGWSDTNGVVAVPTTTVTSGTLSASTGNVVFTPDAAGGTTTLSTSNGTGTTSIELNVAAGQAALTLTGVSTVLNTTGLLLPGANDYAITGAATAKLFGGTQTGAKVVYVTVPTTVLSIGVSMSANFPWVKSGPGTVALTGTADQLNLGTSQVRSVYLNEGVLRAAPGVNLGAVNALAFRGGVLEVTNGGTFARPLGNGNGAVNWTVGNFDGGSGGFSAFGQDVSVNLGGAAATVTWGQDAYFVPDGSALRFGSGASTRTVTWRNPLALDGGTAGAYAAREIEVTKGTGAADKTRFAAAVTGSAATDLLKTGTGVLELAAANSYAGNTLVFAGTLRASNPSGSATGTGAVTVGGGGTLSGAGFLAPVAGKRVTVLAGGTLAPGDALGTLTVAAPVDLADGAAFAWSLADANPSPAAADAGTSSPATLRSQLTVTGAALTAGAVTFRVVEGSPPTFVAGQTYSWPVAVTAAGSTVGGVTFDVSAAPRFAAYGGAARLSLHPSADGSAVYLNFAAVPEPATVGLLAGLGLGLIGLARRLTVSGPAGS